MKEFDEKLKVLGVKRQKETFKYMLPPSNNE